MFSSLFLALPLPAHSLSLFPLFSAHHLPPPLLPSPYVPSLSLPHLLQTLCPMHSHKEIIYSCPPVRVCISMPAEHVNLSHSYRHWVVKLSSDSLQQNDHRMPVAWRITTVVTISNGGPNVSLHFNLLYCVAYCMTQWYALQPKSSCFWILAYLYHFFLARHIAHRKSVWAAVPLLKIYLTICQCLYQSIKHCISWCKNYEFNKVQCKHTQ